MTMDAICDAFGGVHLVIEEGELLLNAPDVLRILELEASEIVVPLDEISKVGGDMSVTYVDEITARDLALLSKEDLRYRFLHWLDTVVVPIHEVVKAYDGEGLKRFRSEGV